MFNDPSLNFQGLSNHQPFAQDFLADNFGMDPTNDLNQDSLMQIETDGELMMPQGGNSSDDMGGSSAGNIKGNWKAYPNLNDNST